VPVLSPPTYLPSAQTDVSTVSKYRGTSADDRDTTEEKARKDMAAKAGGKGPLNTGAQGIKKSGKK
jgi:hypothetical protein